MSGLRRTRVGDFNIREAVGIDKIDPHNLPKSAQQRVVKDDLI
jgi:hypothetical protein